MFGKIVYISNNMAHVQLGENVTTDIMNMHVIFEKDGVKILGEVEDIDKEIIKIKLLGEFVDGKLIGGLTRKPSLDSTLRVIDKEEVPALLGDSDENSLLLGSSPYYDQSSIYVNVNKFFSNHFAIFGNSGSGKSCGVSRVVQNVFENQTLFPFRANMFFFDTSGEYANAFRSIHNLNPNYNYRLMTTQDNPTEGEALLLPIYLLNVDDLALLLQCTNHSQISILEKMLDLARAFSAGGDKAQGYKDYLIARAIMTILYSSGSSAAKRDEIFSILESCNTPNFNIEAEVQGIGYTRKFRECFTIESNGQLAEIILLTEYVSNFIRKEFENYHAPTEGYYTLPDLEKALNFALISEGLLRNENTYSDAVTLKVRLHELSSSSNARFFNAPNFVDAKTFISGLLIKDNKKYQIVNINLDGIDDDLGKAITKTFCRLIFDFTKNMKERGTIPFHLIIEEAHRFIQKDDKDLYLIGYNIFERIAKEGRKYGTILGIISQRPVELSDTVISQCSNFLIFKMTHPYDVDYIRKMLPNITEEIVEKQKSLQPGTCVGFGEAFKIPLIIKMKMPDPSPLSSNCDVRNRWKA